MEFFDVMWAAFLAALCANLVTAIIIYALVLNHRGHSAGQALTKAGGLLWTVSVRAIQVYIGLIVLGAIAFAIKLTVFG